ncbi:MAG TPA: hypothetical protein VGM10_29620 [Actinocrinis sp.]|jgi:hypothetical protein
MMTAIVVLLWIIVLGYAPSLRRATEAFRAQWTTFFVFALALSVGLDPSYVDRLIGIPNTALAIVHLGGVLGAAAQLEFIATALSPGARSVRRFRWRPRHTFTAVVGMLIIGCAVADPDRVEATSTVASYTGSLFEAVGRALMCVHLAVVGFLMLRLCYRTRRAAADRTLYSCLTMMCVASCLGVFYGVIEAAVTVALAAHADLGAFLTRNIQLVDTALIGVVFITYTTGCLIPPLRDRVAAFRDRRTAGRIAPVWTALLGREPDRSLASRADVGGGPGWPGAGRAYLLRLVLESTEARARLAASIPQDLPRRARDALRERGVAQDRLDAATEAAVLRAVLEGAGRPGRETDRRRAQGDAYAAAGAPSAGGADARQDAKTMWWSRVGREWNAAHVAAVADALAPAGSAAAADG